MKDLLKEIEAYLRKRELADSTFGVYAVGNGTVVQRLRDGGEIMRSTESKLRKYMADNPPSSQGQRRATAN